MLLDWSIWIHTEVAVQQKLLQLLAHYAKESPKVLTLKDWWSYGWWHDEVMQE